MLQFSVVILMLGFISIAESTRTLRDPASTEIRRQNEKTFPPRNTRNVRRKYSLFPKTRPFQNYDMNTENAIKYFESNKLNNRTKLRANLKVEKKLKVPERRSADAFELHGKVSQFHSQDSNGRVSFGFNSPYQARFEERDNDGTVRGSYSYVDTNGKKIEVNYWDNGEGFHVQGNHFPTVNDLPQITQFTPEVQAARDMHFRIYDEILASTNRFHDNLKTNSIPVPVVNIAPQVPIVAQDDRFNYGNVIVPTYIPYDDGSDKTMDHDLHFLDASSFAEPLGKKGVQDYLSFGVPIRKQTEQEILSIGEPLRKKTEQDISNFGDHLRKKTDQDISSFGEPLKKKTEQDISDFGEPLRKKTEQAISNFGDHLRKKTDQDISSFGEPLRKKVEQDISNFGEPLRKKTDQEITSFGDHLRKKTEQNISNLSEPLRKKIDQDIISFGEPDSKKPDQDSSDKTTTGSQNISNEFIQYSWRTKPEDRAVSTTETLPRKTLKEAAIVVPNLSEEAVAFASNKIPHISSHENLRVIDRPQPQRFPSRNQETTPQPCQNPKKSDNSLEKNDKRKDFDVHNANVTTSPKRGYIEEVNKNALTTDNCSKSVTTQKPKPTTSTTTTTTTTTTPKPETPLQKFDKIYDLSNAFSDISNTNIFDLSNSLHPKANDSSNNDLKESFDQINNKTISKIYDLTKDSAGNIDTKNPFSSIFDKNNLGFDLPSNINETRLVNSRTNNSFYYHFYHPTTDTLEKEKQGRSNVLSELVGVTSKRLHVSSNKKPYVRPYYYFPVVYP